MSRDYSVNLSVQQVLSLWVHGATLKDFTGRTRGEAGGWPEGAASAAAAACCAAASGTASILKQKINQGTASQEESVKTRDALRYYGMQNLLILPLSAESDRNLSSGSHEAIRVKSFFISH